MNSVRAPALLLVAFYVVFFTCLVATIPQLPATVATHFNGAGQPNGWMSQRGYTIFAGVFAVAIPALIIGGCASIRILPTQTIKLPNRDHWLAPERRDKTNADMLRYGLWLACAMVAFLGGMHWLIVAANRQQPARLSTPAILALIACFLIGMGFWMAVLVRRFKKVA